ncbi:MAG: hypothetical protein ACLGSD_16860 [Acidobacteriota bacterium]
MQSLRAAIDRLVANPLGTVAVLSLAALFETWGDSFFQSAFYRSTGAARIAPILTGILVLAIYGSLVNAPRWDFGRLLGLYVVLFFLAAQVLNWFRFGQAPTPPIYAGGALILAGGLVIAVWHP